MTAQGLSSEMRWRGTGSGRVVGAGIIARIGVVGRVGRRLVVVEGHSVQLILDRLVVFVSHGDETDGPAKLGAN